MPEGKLLYSVELPFPLPSVNKTLHAHWRKKQGVALRMKEDAGWCLKRAPRGIAGPVAVKFTVYYRHANHDAPNCDPKYVIDTLVKLGVIEKDSMAKLREVTLRGELSARETRSEYTLMEIFEDIPLARGVLP